MWDQRDLSKGFDGWLAVEIMINAMLAIIEAAQSERRRSHLQGVLGAGIGMLLRDVECTRNLTKRWTASSLSQRS
jgi:hypothetical protein